MAHNKIISLISALFLYMAASPFAQAQVLTQNTPLSFGRVVLVDNAAPRSIQINPGGGFTADPEYIFFIDPQPGNYTVTGYAPFTPLTVTVGITTLNPLGGGIVNFATSATFTDPAVVVADGAGSATFDVGATLLSDGSGSTHSDDTYQGTYSVTVAP